MSKDKFFHKLTYFSVLFLGIFLFTSFSLAASHHILLLIPGIWFLIRSVREGNFRLGLSSCAILALVIISVLSIVFNDVQNPVRTAYKLRYFLFGILAIFAIEYWLKEQYNSKKIRLLINLFMIASTIATASGLVGLYFGFNPIRFQNACHATRNCGMYGMFMTYAYGIQFFLIILAGMFIFRKKISQYINIPLLYVALVVNLVGFYLSYARGALLGFLIAMPFFFFRRNIKMFAFTVVGILIVSGLAFLFVPKIQGFVFDLDRVTSTNHRLSQYHAAWKVGLERPFFGLGYRNFEPNVRKLKSKWKIPFEWRGGHGHSNFFEHLGSTGFLGLIAILLFHIFWAWESWRRRDSFGDFCLAFIVALFVSGQFQYTLGDGENLFLIMVVYALSQIKPEILTKTEN